MTFVGSKAAIPKQAEVYSVPPPSYQRLLERYAVQRPALERLSNACVVGPDLRHALLLSSPAGEPIL